MVTYWAPFLHLYQPPWQDIEILRQINDECYIPLLSMIERHDNAKFTLNIQGCLINLLLDNGMKNTVDLMKKLVLANKIEIVGTAIFHPILPLIPENEIEHQIKLNESILLQILGVSWKRSGFFPPEMAVSPDLCKKIKNLDYEWMIMGGIANTANIWPQNYILQQQNGLITFFRDDYLSNDISFKKIEVHDFIRRLEDNSANDHYIITAMDGETFGHHIRHYETKFLGTVLSEIEENSNIQLEFISNLKQYFPVKVGPDIRASSWSTDWGDISSNVPYPLWKHPFNPVHKIQYRMLQALYKLMAIVEKEVPKNLTQTEFTHYYQTARWFYDQALHSCWLWWASQRPMWSPNLIYKGIDLIIRTALNAQLALVNLHIGEGDEPYQNIIDSNERLMIELLEQEIAFKKVRTF